MALNIIIILNHLPSPPPTWRSRGGAGGEGRGAAQTLTDRRGLIPRRGGPTMLRLALVAAKYS